MKTFTIEMKAALSAMMNTPEIQAKREAFITAAQANMLALKNAPKLAKLKKEKPTKK